MGMSNLRSLLLAAIFLSNYITWTTCRHHYTHNVNGHRSRHRRQGAGLFLSASYIVPGGEGSGAWGDWGEVSPCSRTCGGGVASQKRICLEVGSDGQPLCTGGDTKYFSCQTQDCPEGSGDFRAEQCSAYDSKTFRDQKYNWVPYTKGPNPCELNCMPRGERFYYRQQLKVTDGTRCNDESFDVCVDGVCQPVGCDMMLGSNSREDKCRRCRGNGTNCYTSKGILDSQDYRKGYNDVLLIPEGATNIVIAEVRESNNYLALRAKQDNVYYLNGDYHIDFPRRLSIAGALWYYERSQQGLAAPDKLRCLGPINEPLYLSLLLQDDNVGIEYEYSVPSALAPPPSQQYVWVHEEFSPCNATCGGGVQTRQVTCRARDSLEEAEERLCDAALRPAREQRCAEEACPPTWVRGAWGPCSRACGVGGSRSRNVHCEKIISNGQTFRFPSIVADKECFDLLGPKPELFEECNRNATCPTWFTEPWKPCDKLCGEGKQTRLVICHQRINGRVELYSDEFCTEEKPASEKSCILHDCDGVDWVLSDWSGCDTCLSTERTRTAHCATKDHRVVAPELCEYHRAPQLREPCDRAALPACQMLWYATQWGKCSAECGKGTQTRRVFCGRFDGVTVSAVEDERCDAAARYNDTRECVVPPELCPAKWFAGPWSECTKECGGGEQYRRVMCLSSGRESLDCDELTVLDSTQTCNTQPCNGDEILPIDSKSTPIMDDYDEEDCEGDDGDYPEENVEVLIPDDPSYLYTFIPEFETTTSLGTEGSGAETTIEYYDMSTVEGSAYSDYTSESTEITASESAWSTETGTTDATESGSTDSTETDLTVTTESGATDISVTTETSLTETTNTDITESTETESTETAVTTEKGTSETEVSDVTKSEPTEITATEKSVGTESEFTDTLVTDLSTETESVVTVSAESPESFGSTGSTETTETDHTASTEESSGFETSTAETGSTDLTDLDYDTDSESPETTTSVTESTETEPSKTGSTETDLTDLTETGSTETTVTELTDTTEFSSTEQSSSTSELSTASEDITTEGSTETTQSVSEDILSTTEISISESESTEASSATSESITESGSSVSDESISSTTESGSSTSESGSSTKESEITESSSSSTIESSPSDTATTESEGATELSSTESSTTESGTTESSTMEPGTTESGTTESGTTESGTTESGSTESDTTESGTTESGITESSTTESDSTESGTTELSVSESETTESGSTELSTTEIGITETSESTSETGSTDVSSFSTTEYSETSPGSTETTESVSSESSTSEATQTTESSISTESGSTTEVSTTESAENTTPWGWTTIVESPKKRRCKARRKDAKCSKSKFGCCPDKITPAAGPFDEGCPHPETCQESKYGCCEDGVSAATGPAERGCPRTPCARTLYGCCRSDNRTAAEGNDQEGCPPPPPACASARYGCCKDNVTEAKGPKNEGCPDTVTTTQPPETTEPPGCEVSEFGCCYDNETDATGPDGEGCPCSITEFGCCPDGVSTSRGLNLEGCEMTCKTSAYGCCADGETPAHGPDGEGCCLQSPFGCCPDNYKAAEGPHLEGCGCQYARFGCCPDNVTIARGPANEGCGCQYTQFGCCPDRYTAAEGPSDQGCSCHTYQFGCCPDGFTVATGPNLQGCLCQQSRYGCCGDGTTPARGPGGEGCDCASSEHGCCPDGVSEAKGKNFLNCTDVPDNRQAACALAKESGSCHNYSVHWYYDMTYGGCSRFWYSGCEGNGNRFLSQAECEDVCVHPAPKDACQLPKVKGACTGYNVRWYYDSSREQCSQFVYGGCLGNDNNFESKELCQKRCEPQRIEDVCQLAADTGPCAGNYLRWAFSGARRCEQFTWGGCGGNDNRFGSEAACLLRCAPPGAPIQACALPQAAGNCTEKRPAWAFSSSENRCVPFYYTGCGGNENRFDSERECSEACPAAHEQEMCTLPALTGECADYSSRWFYDTSIRRCRQFYYGGCGGNKNNFMSERECENACMEIEEPITQPPTLAPTQPPTQPPTPSTQLLTEAPIHTTTQHAPDAASTELRPDFCSMEIDQGPCRELQTRWAYDSLREECTTFEYGGCGGNRNNFPSLEHCTFYCASRAKPQPKPEPSEGENALRNQYPNNPICQLPMSSGPCDQSLMQWFFDAARGVCSQFAYGGCEGNDNRFESQEECERQCKSSVPMEASATSTTTVAPEPLPSECEISSELEECTEAGTVWFLETQTGACVAHENRAAGRACRRAGAFASPEACERACGAFRDLDVCRYAVDAGPCRAALPKVYYDAAARRCEPFLYGGCRGGPNRFSSVAECEQVCKPEIAAVLVNPCAQPPETGNCLASFQMWYYNPARDACDTFVYGGCNGNDNRFETREMCESRCKNRSTTTVAFSLLTDPTTRAPLTTTHEIPAGGECETPASLAPCGENVTAFYFDEATQACLRADAGACRRANNYRSEEECERRCGAFRGLDVCASALDPGPCLSAIPKYYWDALSGRCLEYAYGGCLGGANRFSTEAECQQVCGHKGPAPECLAAAAPGEACGGATGDATGGATGGALRRWYYSAAAGDCLPFVFRGCGGNANNFASHAACAALCLRARTAEEESNEVLPECERYAAECAALRCEYGVQRRRTAAGCERCACVPVHVDCAPLRRECDALACNYGVRRATGDDGCERCTCIEHPCAGTVCAADERCVASPYRDAITLEVRYTTECRIANKPGSCPAEGAEGAEGAGGAGQCRRECNDDADCLGVGKCCARGCSSLCLAPAAAATAAPTAPTATARQPELPQAPSAAAADTEPEVRAAEGGTARLRCLFHGNPPPTITWRWGAITIESDMGRYRLLTDGSLEIVSLYRNDSGVYICVGTNELGRATQEIRLEVGDPVESGAGIAGEPNKVVRGELGQPLNVRCLSYGYPTPAIYWYKGRDGPMVPYSSSLYEARDNVLQIRRLTLETVGEYICQAYNGIDKPAEWSVIVQAYNADDSESSDPFLVTRQETMTTPGEPLTDATTPEFRIEIPVYTVPVSTRMAGERARVAAGAEINLPCDVDGYPLPRVHWTKDGVPLRDDDRTSVTEARLTVQRAQASDSGVYGCHAANAYSSHYSTFAITVEGMYIPPSCKDNPYFATCHLIVKSKFCHHKYYSRFCCKSCVEAGQLDPAELSVQADSWA